jgi:hypothetical protein
MYFLVFDMTSTLHHIQLKYGCLEYWCVEFGHVCLSNGPNWDALITNKEEVACSFSIWIGEIEHW